MTICSIRQLKMTALPPGAVPTALVSTMANRSGQGDKPFTYCPGGVDFSELKSPRMSWRIAKNQDGAEQPRRQVHTYMII